MSKSPIKPRPTFRKPAAKTVAATASTPAVASTLDFYRSDLPKTLFPLKTNLFLIESGEKDIIEYISRCLDEKEKTYAFLPQRRVYAAKPGHHLRRTVKLDVVSEYYLYDVVYKNRSRFRKPFSKDREHFGYRFEDGAPIGATVAYKAFKGAISDYSKKYKHFISIDVASYFNNIYHHDIVNWFRELGSQEVDVSGFGQMLREINSGRSVDCLPQGLYPSKMIGNDFLRFVDNYHGLRSSKIIRFMDDIYLFSDSEQTITDDFILIQTLLGDKGLSINPQKTSRESAQHVRRENQIDAAKEALRIHPSRAAGFWAPRVVTSVHGDR
ncbi:RNA-directed DNA polymerase [Sinorhizobium fredii]|uniref:RNA-directed DNA polymerase n=1 Tax=Rhizobium fredii TaxID=380 RepID=UPI0035166C01